MLSGSRSSWPVTLSGAPCGELTLRRRQQQQQEEEEEEEKEEQEQEQERIPAKGCEQGEPVVRGASRGLPIRWGGSVGEAMNNPRQLNKRGLAAHPRDVPTGELVEDNRPGDHRLSGRWRRRSGDVSSLGSE